VKITEAQLPREITVYIDYPGSIISVNHYKYSGGIYTKPEAKAWMDKLGWMVKLSHIEDWHLPLHITCSGIFEDNRSAPDLSNLNKCILDALQEVSGVNDRDMRWYDGTRVISCGTDNPRLLITIKEGD